MQTLEEYELEYCCKCGYSTPVSTGMMLHLSYPENQNSKHGFTYATKKAFSKRPINLEG